MKTSITQSKNHGDLVSTPPVYSHFDRNKGRKINDWSVLPCEGVFKLSKPEDKLEYRYCSAAYWKCPNKRCIMRLT